MISSQEGLLAFQIRLLRREFEVSGGGLALHEFVLVLSTFLRSVSDEYVNKCVVACCNTA